MRAVIAFAAAGVGVALAAPAMAQATSLYGGVQAGYAWSDANVTIPAYPARFSDNTNAASGGAFAGVSFDVADDWSISLEADGDWSDGQARHLTAPEFAGASEDYQISQSWTAAARLLLAYRPARQTQIYAALGAAWTSLETRYIPEAGGRDTAIVSGWTIAAGAQHDYDEHLFTRAEIRYTDYARERFFHLGPSTVDMNSTALLLGVGYRFGGRAARSPEPPAPEVLAPASASAPTPVCAPESFVVYFDWNSARLSETALEAIQSTAARTQQCRVSAVSILGYADTSGSAQYNIDLSMRRASVVRDALVTRGVPEGALQVEARGETELARQTRNGVEEPLNRRTAVTIHLQ